MGYSYRKQHTINGAEGAGTNYQLKLKAYYDKRPIGSFTYVSTTGADVYSCQGVATDGTYFYTTAGDDNKHLYKFNSSWILQGSHDCSADWPVGCTQVNSIFYKDGKLYLGACDYPDATPEGWIMVYNASDLSYDTVHNVGAIECEGCAYYDGYWWVIRGDQGQVKKYNTSWVHQTDYNLTHVSGGNSLFCPGYQGIMWKDDFIYVTVHKDCTPEERCDAYYFDGTNFTLIKRMNPPTIYCSQGLCLDPDGETVWWAERDHGGTANDDRVIKTTIAWDNEEIGLNKHCKTDFGDLQITKSDSSIIYAGNSNGWREHKIDGVFDIIWWKMPEDLGTSKNIYLYYGNDAASWSDGGISSIMDHVNDFETGTVQDFTNAYNGGSAEASVTEKYEGSYSIKTLGASKGVYSDDKTFWNTAKKAIDIWMLSTANNVEATICWVVSGDNIKRVIISVEIDGVEYTGSAGVKQLIKGDFTSNWIKYSVKLNADATKFNVYAYNKNLVPLGHITEVGFSEVSRTYRDILLYDAINYCDLIFSHKYTVPEPTGGVWGAEEKLITSTDSGQSDETVGTLLSATVADTGSFTDTTITESNILWEDTCNSNETTQLDTQTIVSDVVYSSESVMDLYVIGAFDVSGSSDYASIQTGSKEVSDYGDGISAVVIESHTLSEDSGGFSENVWTTCSLEFLDSGSFIDRIGTGSILGEDKLGTFVLGTTFVVSQIVEDTGNGVSFVAVDKEILISDLVGLSENVVVESFIEILDSGSANDVTNLVVDIETTDSVSGVATVPSIEFTATDTSQVVETIGLSVTCPVTDIGQSVETVVLSASYSVTDTGQSEDIASLTATHSATDSGQTDETVGLSGKVEATDSGSFIDRIGTGSILGEDKLGTFVLGTTFVVSQIVEDSGSILDSVEITSHVGCIDTVSVSENITNICSSKTIDYSTSEDNAYYYNAVLSTDTADGTSIVSMLGSGTSGDLGQFVESSTITGSLAALDESTGHAVGHWELGYYHDVDKSIIVSFTNRSVGVSPVDRTTNIKFKRRSVRKR